MEVLLATILLWVAVFGLIDELMQYVGKSEQKIAFYALLALFVICWVYVNHGISFCTLM